MIWCLLASIALAAAVIAVCWDTPDKSPWYVKRLDFSRGSVQHRIDSWKAGFEIMWNHPLGVGWNNTVKTYTENYSSPEGGAAAITTNDYLMIGTQLGIPALLCFLTYVWLSFRARVVDPTQIACRAGAIAMLIAFWFDGGLFALATAVVFWILLELGSGGALPRMQN